MRPSHRIVMNTAAIYGRSVLAAVLALFSSRWVLHALGQADYGLYCLVGSVIAFVTFFNGVMANSVARHFAFSMGQGDSDVVRHWFNAALGIHLLLPAILIALGWPIGEYCIRHVLDIPAPRIAVGAWVFRFSLVAAFFGMVSIPYVAMFTARQRIAELAAWGAAQSVLMFGLAAALAHVRGDRLLAYAAGMAAISVCMQIGQATRAMRLFPECHVRQGWVMDVRRFKDMLAFALWSLIGCLGGMFRSQGSAILLNLNFGTKVNAAYGIANLAAAQTGTLAASMTNAFTPEITSSEGGGDRARMLDLTLRTCKFGTLLVVLFAVPLLIEMNAVLRFWLSDIPRYTTVFCQCMLAMILFDNLTVGYLAAVNAGRRIAAYQATLGLILVLTLPLAWALIRHGLAPTCVGVAFVVTAAICSLGRVLWGRHLFGLPVSRWLARVVLPCMVVTACSAAAALVPACLFPQSLLRILLVGGASLLAAGPATWFLALDDRERVFAKRCLAVLRARLGWIDGTPVSRPGCAG